jgi:hypothetical protein
MNASETLYYCLTSLYTQVRANGLLIMPAMRLFVQAYLSSPIHLIPSLYTDTEVNGFETTEEVDFKEISVDQAFEILGVS